MRFRILFAALGVLLAVSTVGITSADNGEVSVTLDSVNNSGISGHARLVPKGNQTEVIITVAHEPSGVSEPVHIHNGPCTRLDPQPLYPLRNVEDGTSDTLLNMPLSSVTTGRLVINIHKSAADFGSYVACGPIPTAAPPTTTLDWATKTKLPEPLANFAVAVSKGQVYTIGGTSASRRRLARVDEWNPTADSWTTRASLPSARASMAAAVTADGKIFVFGGEDDKGVLATVDEYNPSTDSWTSRARMPTRRSDLTAAGAANGRIYVIGGMDADGKGLSTVEEYNPATNSWTTRAPMPTSRADLAVAMVNGKLYAVGGTSDGRSALGTVEEYDPATDTWVSRAPMPTPRLLFGITTQDGKIYVLGGAFPGVEYTAKVEEYDPATNTWTTKNDLPTPRSSASAFTLGNGHIYLAGGCCLGADILSSVDEATFTLGRASTAPTSAAATVAATMIASPTTATTTTVSPTAAARATTTLPTAVATAAASKPKTRTDNAAGPPVLPIAGAVILLGAVSGGGVMLGRRRSIRPTTSTSEISAGPAVNPPTPDPPRITPAPKVPSWPPLARNGTSSDAGSLQPTVLMPPSVPDTSSFNLSAAGYHIVGEPKSGGMATVYRAQQPALDRFVAIKVLAPMLATDPSFVQRFYEEARRTAHLEHPNIVPIYDMGQAPNGSLYLAMRYIEGLTLQELLELEHPLAVPRAIRIARQVGEALAYAHNRGIIHRDVKPSNIMIEGGDRATLMDFGIAKLSDGSGVTQPGLVVGTPKYLSPEQAAGEQADNRSDLYSLGVVLYEMVAGRPPFESDNPRTLLQAHLIVTPPPPTQFNSAIPDAAESVVLKALAKERTSRYPSAEALVADLRALEEHVS